MSTSDLFTDTIPRLQRRGDCLEAVFDTDATDADPAPVGVTLRLLRPLSDRDGAVSLIDKDKKERCLLPSLSVLDPASRELAEADIAMRYPAPRIKHLLRAWCEHGNRYIEAETAHGRRCFLIHDPQSAINWLDKDRALIKDSAGNRYLLDSITKLDAKSQQLLQQVL